MTSLKGLKLAELKDYNRRKHKQAFSLYQDYKVQTDNSNSKYKETFRLESQVGLDNLLQDVNRKLLSYYK